MTTIKEAKAKLAPLGWTIRKTDGGDYRVAPSGAGNESIAYYSDSLDDALNTGILEAGGNPWESECQDCQLSDAENARIAACHNSQDIARESRRTWRNYSDGMISASVMRDILDALAHRNAVVNSPRSLFE